MKLKRHEGRHASRFDVRGFDPDTLFQFIRQRI